MLSNELKRRLVSMRPMMGVFAADAPAVNATASAMGAKPTGASAAGAGVGDGADSAGCSAADSAGGHSWHGSQGFLWNGPACTLVAAASRIVSMALFAAFGFTGTPFPIDTYSGIS